MVNGIHFEVAKLSSPFDPSDAADEVSTKLTTAYKAMLGTGDTLHDLTVTQVGVAPADVVQHVKTLEVAGTRTLVNNALEDAVCAVISLKTGTPKRFARGRLFAPPCLDSDKLNNGGVFLISGSYLINVKAFAALLTAAWTAGDDTFAPIVWSELQYQRAATAVFPISAYACDGRQHWLRSRMGSKP